MSGGAGFAGTGSGYERAPSPRPRRAPLGHDAAPRRCSTDTRSSRSRTSRTSSPSSPTGSARPIDVDAFVDDLRRLHDPPRLGRVRSRTSRAAATRACRSGEAIGAVYETYAAAQRQERWGDKTPMYMQHLPLLERLFPDARLRPPDPGRPRRGACPSSPCRKGSSRGPGRIPQTPPTSPVSGARRCRPRARSAARVGPAATSRCATRRSSPTPEDVLQRDLRVRRPRVRARHARLRGRRSTSPRSRTSRACTRPPTPGLRDWRTELAPRKWPRSSRWPATSCAELGYRRPARGRSLAGYARRTSTARWRGRVERG